jgi:uncharacterized repeat protein (TIGR01451 family)
MELAVTGTTAGVKNNSVTATSNEGGTGNTSTASLTVTAVSPAMIYKAFTPRTTMKIGEPTALQFTISNPASFALTGVSFIDTLPSGVVISTPSGLSNNCNGSLSAVAGSGVISLSGTTLPVGGLCSLELKRNGNDGWCKKQYCDRVVS